MSSILAPRSPAARPDAGPSTRVDVCIHGAGPVGATLALALVHEGFSVALVEEAGARPANAGPDLRAYALNPASIALLQRLRVWDALPATAATPVERMRIHGDAGGRLDFSAWQQEVRALAWIVDAGALDASLAQALAYAPRLQRLKADQGAAPAGALRAICEGRESATRAALGVRFPVQHYGHRGVAAWVGSDQPHDGCAWQWFREPDVLALLPFDRAGVDAEGRPTDAAGYGIVWSVPDARADELLALSDADFEAELNAASGGAAGQLRLRSARMAWPLRYGRASAMAGAGWVLVGDAAHAVHPLSGHGLNLGLGDVEALVHTLVQAREATPWRSLGDARSLRAYARARAAPVWLMGSTTDALWQLFGHPDPVLRRARNLGLDVVNHLTPLKRWLGAQARG